MKHINLYPYVLIFLKKIKALEKLNRFKSMNLHIHHFIVSAGLKELIEECFPRNLITWTFGCRYVMTKEGEGSEEKILNVPVFCMDETMKTRSIFEISKGTFNNPQ